MLLSMPAVEALHERYPDAEIWMMTLPYTADIPARYPFVTRVVTLDTNGIRSIAGLLRPSTLRQWYGVYRLLRLQRFDLAVSLCGLMASIWTFLSGATHRIGYRKEAYPLLHTYKLPGRRYDRRRHEARWCLDICEGFLLACENEKRRVTNHEKVEKAIALFRQRVSEARIREKNDARRNDAD